MHIAEDPDFEYTSTIVFSLKNEGTGYQLSSDTQIRQVCLSARSLSQKVWRFESPASAPIRKFKVYHNNLYINEAVVEYPKVGYVYLDDDRIVEVPLPVSRVIGDTISVSYSQSYLDIAYLPIIHIPNINARGSFTIRFVHPRDVAVDPEIYFPRDEIHYQLAENHPNLRLCCDSILLWFTILLCRILRSMTMSR